MTLPGACGGLLTLFRIPQFLAICKAFAGGFAESFPVGGLGDGVAGGLQHRTVVTLRAGACSGAGFWGVRPCGAARRSPYGAQHRRAAGDLLRYTGQRLPPQGRFWCVRRTGFTASLRCLALMGDRKTARQEPGGLGMMRFFGSSRCACRMLGEAFPLSRWCNA